MIRNARRNSRLLLALILVLPLASIVRADDITGINGLWATDARNCDKIFSKTQNGFAFAKESDLYGSGIIVDGRRIVTPNGRCDIKVSKQDGAITHLIAGCATDVMNKEACLAKLSALTNRYPMDVGQDGMAPHVMRLNVANLYDYLTSSGIHKPS